MDTLTISVHTDYKNQIIDVELNTGTKKISIGLNASEAQEFSTLLGEAAAQLTIENMWLFEAQQSGPKH